MKRNLFLVLAFSLLCVIPFNVDAMRLFVKIGDDSYTLEVDPSDTIDSIKQRVFDQIDIPVESQVIKYNDNVLQDNRTLADYSIQKESEIIIESYGIVVDNEVLNSKKTKNTSGSATFDDENNILTLNNYSGGAISYFENSALKIVLKGENTIENINYGIYSLLGDISITGDGSLDITAGGMGIAASEKLTIDSNINISKATIGIVTEGDLIIDGGNINIDTGILGLFITEKGSLIINDGVIDITSGEDGMGAAILLLKNEGKQEININSNLQVVLNQGYSLIDAHIEYAGDEFEGLTFSKEKANIVIDDGVDTETSAYKLVIKPKNKVVFNTLGGNTIDSIYLEDNQTVTKPTDPKKEGYKFLGWYNADKEYNFDTKVTRDVTLVAAWEKVAEEIPDTIDNVIVFLAIGVVSMISIMGYSLYVSKKEH